jgi:phage terminase large subunit
MGKLIHGIIADEAGYLPDWAWPAILPLLADNDAWLFEIGTTNGRNRFFEHYQRGLDEAQPKWGAFRLNTRDNTFLPAPAYDELVSELTPEEIATEIEALFTRRKGAVFPDFDEDLHLRTLRDERRVIKRLGGIDWGSTNPAVVLPILIDADDNAWTPDEWYRREATLEQHRAAARKMMERWGVRLFIADPSEPQMIKFFRSGGVPIRPASQEDAAVLAGVNTLRRRLGNYSYTNSRGDEVYREPSWFIDPERCPNLFNELVNYHYADGTANRDPGDAPVKQGDHAIDAARYVLHRHDRRSKGVLPAARSVCIGRLKEI